MGLISNGTTVFDSGSMASGFGGSMTHIKTITVSSPTDNVQFVHGVYVILHTLIDAKIDYYIIIMYESFYALDSSHTHRWV